MFLTTQNNRNRKNSAINDRHACPHFGIVHSDFTTHKLIYVRNQYQSVLFSEIFEKWLFYRVIHWFFFVFEHNTPVGINEKGFVNSNSWMFLLVNYCIEILRGVCRYAVDFEVQKLVRNNTTWCESVTNLAEMNNFWRFERNVDQYPSQRRTYSNLLRGTFKNLS